MFSEWRELPLGDIVTLKRGYDLPSGERNQSGRVPIVSSSGISGYHDSAMVKAPGVVTGRYGSIGNFFYLLEDFWPLNTSLYVQDFKGNHPYFIYYLLQILNFAQYSDKTSVPGVNRNDLHRIKVKLPSLNEQRKIAEILSTWDEAIDLTVQLIAAKQQRKQALMQRLLTGEVRFSGFVDKWQLVTLGEIFTFLRTAALSRSELTSEITDDTVFNIHYGDIHSTYISDILDFSDEERIPKVRDNGKLAKDIDYLKDGDLVIADVSEDYAGVGVCVEVANIHDRKVTGGLHTFAVRDEKGVTAQGYRCLILKAPQVAKKLKQLATGVSVYGISKTNLSKLEFYLPSIEEQRKIATLISACNDEISLLSQKLTALRQQKQGLMQQLLTGNIRVKV